MIRPVLEYGSIIFDNCTAQDSIKLENCQRHAALICTGAMRRTETDLLLRELHWDKLSTRRRFFKLTFFYKILNNLTSPYLKENIEIKNSNDAIYNTRSSDNQIVIQPTKCRLSHFKKSFFPETIKHWNSLSNETKMSTSLTMFKQKLAVHFCLESTRKEPDNNLLDHLHSGFFGNLLTQMRFGLSPLNSHLFKYNIQDNPFCPSCGEDIETVEHFFLECAKYEIPRTNLLLFLQPFLHNNVTSKDIVKLVLYGIADESHFVKLDINRKIFRFLKIYMYKTKRFDVKMMM